jgi:uncharacterized membrane protein YeaQ/YmgE (transglycosylase-associated protein family)
MGAALVILLVIIAILLVGGAIIGLAFHLLWLLLAGLVIGALARLVLPGRQDIGAIGTALCGIAGSLLGGIIGHILGGGSIVQFLLGIVVAAGAIALFEGGSRSKTI